MDIVRCNWCGHVDIDDPSSCHCKKCGRNDCLMDLDGTEEFDDAQLQKLWSMLGDIPINPISECIEEAFLFFPEGAHREDIWDWFDEHYAGGVASLMYR